MSKIQSKTKREEKKGKPCPKKYQCPYCAAGMKRTYNIKEK